MITMAGDTVVNEVPLFWTRVHPWCLVLISQLEDGVSNQQVAQRQKPLLFVFQLHASL